jgi:hypothetical protein
LGFKGLPFAALLFPYYRTAARGPSVPVKMKRSKGFRYTEDQKRMILIYVKSYGEQGVDKAVQEFGVSPVSLYRWLGTSPGRGRKKPTSSKAKPKLSQREVIRIQQIHLVLMEFKKGLTLLQKQLKALL